MVETNVLSYFNPTTAAQFSVTVAVTSIVTVAATLAARALLVWVRRNRRLHRSVANINRYTTRRDATVNALYERLNCYHIVLVRGTPASGKSTLAQLLLEHIKAKEGVRPILINDWPQESWRSNWLGHLVEYGYSSKGQNIIIIDEAQLTYWDFEFWNILKNITSRSYNRFILFASYGSSTGYVPETRTNAVISALSSVSLQPVDHKDEIGPVGLFLTTVEFADMVQRLCPSIGFEADFLDYVLRITAGHAGAVADLLKLVMAHDSYRKLKHIKRKYSLETFQSQFGIKDLWSGLQHGIIFKRGLPDLTELQKPNIARVFRAVLSNNFVEESLLKSKEDKKALEQCWERGWLHATQDRQYRQIYIFTTPLHRWFIEYYLGTKVVDPTPVADQDVRTFAINVIRLFSPLHLSSERQIGTSEMSRPLERRFHDEFYRCCHQYSNRSLISFPEFGNASGRTDLYIPRREWGVELLRDGDGLENHSSHFTAQGAYAKMEFRDYIILDFCTKKPKKKYPKIPKLYHIVLDKEYRKAQILDGSLKEIEKFELLD